MKKSIGLYGEVIATLVFLLGAALLLGGFLLLRLSEQQLLDQRVGGIIAQVRLMTRSVAGTEYGEDDDLTRLARFSRLVRDLPSDQSPLSWTLTDSKLKVVATRRLQGESIGNASDLQAVLTASEPLVRVDYRVGWLPWDADEGSLLISQAIRSGGKVLGGWQARFSLADVRLQILAAYRLTLLYILLYGTVLVGFGVLLLSLNVVQPIRRLRQATQAIAEGDLETQLPIAGPREISDLSGAFNTMADALRVSRGETEAHINQLSQANDDLKRTQEELIRSAKMASVGHLAAGMAHEIGNPLGAVVGYLELLKSRCDDSDQRDLLVRSLEELGRVDHLVRDLLDYAAPAEEQTELVEPGKVLEEALGMLIHQGAFGFRTVRKDWPDRLPPVRMVRHKLVQVLVNLLLNARDATAEEGTVQLSAALEGSEVVIRVADNGSGISGEVQRQLFDPFFTTKAPGKGRGLGLAVALRIVEEAGGKLLVESTAGSGSVFILRLPVVGEEEP